MQRMRTSLEVEEGQWFTSKVSKPAMSIGFLERRLSLPAKRRTPVQQPRRWQIRGILTPSTKLTRRVVVAMTETDGDFSREERVEMANLYWRTFYFAWTPIRLIAGGVRGAGNIRV